MRKITRKDFCIECRKETEYCLKKKTIVKKIKEKDYSFEITTAICDKCGSEMSIQGLIDKNVQEIDNQYRSMEGLVSVEDIEKLMKIYNIGKAPLSLALGFGEVTITRYLEGQIPSYNYSDVIRCALASPLYMMEKLKENKDKISVAAYRKAYNSAESMEKLFAVSFKMLRVIAYIFKSLDEVTPLMLQKLLYFTQGVYLALYNKNLFEEDCEAWAHGPVYTDVYNLFRDFKYNPIEDARFAIIEGVTLTLSDDEKNVIDMVLNTFGMYGGKTLEKITHNEGPWKDARRGYDDGVASNAIVEKKDIREYFVSLNAMYDISDEGGLREYISDMLEIDTRS